MCLQYGADLVWGPEVVDRAVIGAERVVDGELPWPALPSKPQADASSYPADRTGLVTYQKNGKPIWWTHPLEKDQLIYVRLQTLLTTCRSLPCADPQLPALVPQQIGTADPELAVQAALTVQGDVAGVDLNCGCPKPFSTHNGAGAGLLSTPELLCNILTSLVAAVNVPVSCKIRLLPDQKDTLELVEKICQTGIKNLTVHARTKTMRSTERALIERLRDIVEVADRYGIPVAANGDVVGMWDFERIKELTGPSCSSI